MKTPQIFRRTCTAAALLGLGLGVSLPAQAKSIGNEALSPGNCKAEAGKTPNAFYLALRITGLRSAKGRVTLDFYGSNPNDFLAKGKKIIKIHVPAATGAVLACVKLPAPGRYAIAGYHDENDNHHFDRNLLGMPTEGYTFSRDPNALIVPAYKDTAFETKGRITPVTLKIHYP